MAPKRSSRKRMKNASSHSSRHVSMKLRSKGMAHQEACSRVMPMTSPPKKRGRVAKRLSHIDDEDQVEEGSNNMNEETEATDTNADQEESDDKEEESNEIEEKEDEDNKYSRHLGKQVPLGLMKDVLSQFYVKRRTLPPLVPLCCLVAHEVARFATDMATWLIPSFDTAAYLETMGHFLVSLAGPSGGTMHVTAQNLEEWGPLWRWSRSCTTSHLEYRHPITRERRCLISRYVYGIEQVIEC